MKLIKNVKWYVIVTGFVLFSILSVGSYAYLNDTKTTSKMQLSLKLSANQSVRLVQDKSLLAQTRVDYSKITPLHFNENKTENEIYFYNFTGRTGKFAYNTEIGNILDNTSQAGRYANNIAKQLKGKINIRLSSEKANILPSWLDQENENENKIKLTITTSEDFPEAYYNKPLRIGFDIELHDKSGKVQFSDGSTFMKDQWIVVQIDKPTESNYPSDEVYEVKQALSYMYNGGKFYTITPGVVFNKDTSTLTQEQIDTLKRKYSNQTEQKIVYSNDFNIKVDNVEYVNGKGFKITYSLSETQNQKTLDNFNTAESIQKYPTGYIHLGWIDSVRVYKGYSDVIRPVFLSSDLNLANTNYNLLTDKTILTRSQPVDVQFLTKTTSSAQTPQLFNDTSLSSKFTVKIIGDDSSAFNTPSIVQNNDKGTAIRISQTLGVSAGKRALLQIIEQETNKVVLQRELQTTSEFTPNIDDTKYNISEVVTANYNLFRYAPKSMTVKFDSSKQAYVGNLIFYFKLENKSSFTNMLPTYRFILSTPNHMKVLSEQYSADCQWLQVNLEYSSNEDINTIKANPIDFNYRILGQISDNNSSSDLQTDSYFSYNNSIFK